MAVIYLKFDCSFCHPLLLTKQRSVTREQRQNHILPTHPVCADARISMMRSTLSRRLPSPNIHLLMLLHQRQKLLLQYQRQTSQPKRCYLQNIIVRIYLAPSSNNQTNYFLLFQVPKAQHHFCLKRLSGHA